nr:MoaD/ThiS family protein [Candidatus Sigynarchaeota archaeon]
MKLIAEMRKIFDAKEIMLDFTSNHVSVQDVLKRLLKMEHGGARASRLLLKNTPADSRDFSSDDVNPALLVMVNDVDFRLIGGVDAQLADNDAVTLLPTIHGG